MCKTKASYNRFVSHTIQYIHKVYIIDFVSMSCFRRGIEIATSWTSYMVSVDYSCSWSMLHYIIV